MDNPTIIFKPLVTEELSLLDNIQNMNKLKHKIISDEFYKLFAKFEKPEVSFLDILIFIWTKLGGAVRLMFCLICTSMVLGSKIYFFNLIFSWCLLQKNRNDFGLNYRKKYCKNEKNKSSKT